MTNQNNINQVLTELQKDQSESHEYYIVNISKITELMSMAPDAIQNEIQDQGPINTFKLAKLDDLEGELERLFGNKINDLYKIDACYDHSAIFELNTLETCDAEIADAVTLASFEKGDIYLYNCIYYIEIDCITKVALKVA